MNCKINPLYFSPVWLASHMLVRVLLGWCIFAAFWPKALAALTPPILVQDLNRSTSSLSSGGSNEVVNGKFIRMLRFKDHGLELSSTDTAGTQLLANIGPGSSDAPIVFLPNNFVNLGHILFFTVNASEHSREVWRTDGTTLGTVKLKTISQPQDKDGKYVDFTIYYAPFSKSQALILISTTESGLSSLVLSDGSVGGTFDVSLASPIAIHSPVPSGEAGFFAGITSGGGALFRLEQDRVVRKIRDFTELPAISSIFGIKAIQPNLYLGKVNYTTNVDTIFITNGTEGSFLPLTSVSDLVGSISNHSILFSEIDRAYFSVRGAAGTSLWETRGTNESTAPLLDLSNLANLILRGDIFSFNRGVLFHARSSSSGDEFWYSKAPFSSPTLLGDLIPGSATKISTASEGVVFSPTKAAFLGQSSQFGEEIYITDGTPDGTAILSDLTQGKDSGAVYTLRASSDNTFYFLSNFNNQVTLFKSDGSIQGTSPITNFNMGLTQSSSPLFLDSLTNDVHLLSAQTGAFRDDILSYNEKTGSVTSLLPSVRRYRRGTRLGKVGSNIFFGLGTEDTGVEIWKSDGTAKNTQQVKDINFGPKGSNPSPFAVFPSGLLFWAKDEDHGIELFRTDGTTEGTRIFKEFAAGTADGRIDNLPTSTIWDDGELAYLAAKNEQNAYEIWVTDGTENGTRKLATSPANSRISGIDTFVRFKGKVYFPFFSGSSGAEIWSSDGTPEGTGVAIDLATGISGSDPIRLTKFGDRLLFYTLSEPAGIWISDGSIAGTTRLREGRPFFATLLQITASQNYALFNWEEDDSGLEPWVTDGTMGGTFRLKDIAPGDASSNPIYPLAFRDRVYFAARNDELGLELWSTNGTVEGTELVQDIRVGKYSSGGLPIGKSSTALFISADDGTHGAELFSIREQNDLCPNNPSKVMPEVCGCNNSEVDTDSDGSPDCIDACPQNSFKDQVGACGCNFLELYRGSSDQPYCQDACSGEKCACNSSSIDSDKNGIADCNIRGEILLRLKKARKSLKAIRFNSTKNKHRPGRLLKDSKKLLKFISIASATEELLRRKDIKKILKSYGVLIKNSKQSPFNEQKRGKVLKLLKVLEKKIKSLAPVR